jgi:hypothetical protein
MKFWKKLTGSAGKFVFYVGLKTKRVSCLLDILSYTGHLAIARVPALMMAFTY